MLLVDLLAAAETAPLELPLPSDARAVSFARRLMAEPGATASLADLARGSGALLRKTLQRLFQAQTGLSLEAWRARVRMQQAVVALSAGAPVTEAALDAGYQSASAFIAAFKRAFGVTPARYRARPSWLVALTERSRALARRSTPPSRVSSRLEKHRRTMWLTGSDS